MKVAISTDQGYVSAHFGRCQSYTIIEVKEGQVLGREEIPNPGHQPGFLPEYLSEKGINCIIAGGMGPRAQDLFLLIDRKYNGIGPEPIPNICVVPMPPDGTPLVDVENVTRRLNHPRGRGRTIKQQP